MDPNLQFVTTQITANTSPEKQNSWSLNDGMKLLSQKKTKQGVVVWNNNRNDRRGGGGKQDKKGSRVYKTCSYSLFRFLLKKLAHSEQVFLLPTQKTGEMPTINVNRYFIRNKNISGLASTFAWKTIKDTQENT